MRRLCAGLRTCLLLAVAFTVAAHPLARSLSQSHLANAAAEWQIIICTSHGPVAIEEPSGTPPSKQNPSCPWCAICAGSAGKLPALTTTLLGQFTPRQLVQHGVVVSQSTAASAVADWPAHAPRGPPAALSA